MENNRQLTPRFVEALRVAAEVHLDQTRKGEGQIPYLGHLLTVAGTVIDVGGDEDQAIAALLHDAVEDCGHKITLAEIEKKFGKRVARMVDDASDMVMVEKDQKKGPWLERKQAHIDKVSKLRKSSALVISADKLHNARALVRDFKVEGPALWKRFSGNEKGTKWYYREMLSALRNAWPENPILPELSQAVSDLDWLTVPDNNDRRLKR